MKKDEVYIKRCFELAKKATGYTSPNPLVGCVIVCNNKIIAEGYHTAFGKPHAEVEAINDAIKNGYKDLLKKATLYVNLEPCSHWGKTPPCVDKIIEVGIKRVVCSMIDPNPLVKGKGIKKLLSKRIECKVGVLEEEAKELNKFYIKWITKKLPYVTIKMASTFDGKVATKKGESKWISNRYSRYYVHKLRSEYDAVLVGINTVVVDNPKLTTHGQGRNPVRIIVGNLKNLKYAHKKYNVFDDKVKTIIFTDEENSNFAKIRFSNTYFYFYSREIKFKDIFSKLAKDHNVSSVLVEGGPNTVWRILDEKLADDIILFVAPKIFGGINSKTWVEGEGVERITKAINVEFINIESMYGDLIIKAKILS